MSGYRPVPELPTLARFPAARRDLSLVVAEDVRYDQLAGLAREIEMPDLEAVEHAATYRGKPLPAGQKKRDAHARVPPRGRARSRARTPMRRLARLAELATQKFNATQRQ